MPGYSVDDRREEHGQDQDPDHEYRGPIAFSLVAPCLPIASPTILIAMMTSAMAASRLRMP